MFIFKFVIIIITSKHYSLSLDLPLGQQKLESSLEIRTKYHQNADYLPCFQLDYYNNMKNNPKDQEFQEGELPDDQPSPNIPTTKLTQEIKEKPKNKLQSSPAKPIERDDQSSGEIVFETVTEKDYKDLGHSPEKKRKKIQKQEVKAKTKDTKERERADRSSYDKEKKYQKRVSPVQKEQPSPYQPSQPIAAQPQPQFYNPYMYLPPVSHLPPIYNPQYPPYVHPSQQFKYPNQMPASGPHPLPIPMQMNHPNYPMMQSMYPAMQNKSGKQPEVQKFQSFKPHPQQFHQPYHPSSYPNEHHSNSFPPYHQQNQVNIHSLPNQINQINQMPLPSNNKPQFQQKFKQKQKQKEKEKERQKQREKEKTQFQITRDKKIEFREQIKKQLKKTVKPLDAQTQSDILQALKCIIKYGHLCPSLFASTKDLKTQIAQNSYEKYMDKFQRILSQEGELAEVITRLLTTLQITEPLLKLKERRLFNKIISKGEQERGEKIGKMLEGIISH